MFVLRHVVVAGAVALPREKLVTAYQPYLGKKVSQADLADMASAVSDVAGAAFGAPGAWPDPPSRRLACRFSR